MISLDEWIWIPGAGADFRVCLIGADVSYESDGTPYVPFGQLPGPNLLLVKFVSSPARITGMFAWTKKSCENLQYCGGVAYEYRRFLCKEFIGSLEPALALMDNLLSDIWVSDHCGPRIFMDSMSWPRIIRKEELSFRSWIWATSPQNCICGSSSL